MSAVHDLALKIAPCFTGYLKVGDRDPAGTVIRAMTMSSVPCNQAAFTEHGKGRASFVILGFMRKGWLFAPYKKPSKNAKAVKAQNAQPLFEDDPCTPGAMTMYNFHKASNNIDKGERDSNSVSTLRVSQTLTFFLNDFMYGEDKGTPVFPTDRAFIPAHSIVDIVISPTHNQSDGFGCKLNRVIPHHSTLYSYVPMLLDSFACTLQDAKARAETIVKECAPIKQCVEQSRVCFFNKVNNWSYVAPIRDDIPFVRLSAEDGNTPLPGVPNIDISKTDLLRFTNCPGDFDRAMRLIDFAAASGSLSMFVIYDEWFDRGEPCLMKFRGVPLIDTENLLQAIDVSQFHPSNLEDGQISVDFPLQWAVPGVDSFRLSVSSVPVKNLYAKGEEQDCGQSSRTLSAVVAKKELEKQPCPDLCVMSPLCLSDRAYPIEIIDNSDNQILLDFLFNAASGGPLGGGCGGGTGRRMNYKRAREESVIEEDAE